MNRRTGLTWVTALTIASLLLGGGALNALAEGHGGGNAGGNGKANAEHQQQTTPAQVHKSDDKRADTAKHDAVPQAKHDDAQAKHDAHNDNDNDNDDASLEPRHDAQNDKDKDKDKDNASLERRHGADMDRDHEDLVTGPDRVTGEDRPGLGCGDPNHEHTGAPGNPDKECKDDRGGDDDETTVATVDQDAS